MPTSAFANRELKLWRNEWKHSVRVRRPAGPCFPAPRGDSMPALTTSLANWFDKPHAEPVVFLDSVSLCRNFFRSNGDGERGGDESRIGSNHRFEPLYAPFPSA